MVFCKRIESYTDHAVYDYGAKPDKLSGRVTMYADNRHFTVDRKSEDVPDKSLVMVWLKYKKSFVDNGFPERMAIQIG